MAGKEERRVLELLQEEGVQKQERDRVVVGESRAPECTGGNVGCLKEKGREGLM